MNLLLAWKETCCFTVVCGSRKSSDWTPEVYYWKTGKQFFGNSELEPSVFRFFFWLDIYKITTKLVRSARSDVKTGSFRFSPPERWAQPPCGSTPPPSSPPPPALHPPGCALLLGAHLGNCDMKKVISATMTVCRQTKVLFLQIWRNILWFASVSIECYLCSFAVNDWLLYFSIWLHLLIHLNITHHFHLKLASHVTLYVMLSMSK